jgi:hypothetical protein
MKGRWRIVVGIMILHLSKEAEGSDAPSLLGQGDVEVPHLTGL